MALWIGLVMCEPDVERKLTSKHGIDIDTVRRAIAFGVHDRAAWHHHPDFGRRLVVTGSVDGVRLVAYLRPIDENDGTWECLTAWRL